jgi:hypothetical protein
MKNRNRRVIGIVTAILALSSSACWATLIESESNDSIGTADPITPLGAPIWADAGEMELGTGGDVDFFSIELKQGEILMAATTPLVTSFTEPDTILALFDQGGTILALNDNAGSDDPGDSEYNLGSKIEYQVDVDDTYFIRVVGSDNNQVGAYALTVTVIPEPATLILLALGAMLFLRKRIVFQS